MTTHIKTLIAHEMMCPRCKSTDLHIQVPMWTALLPDGADLQQGDQEWDDDSPVECQADDYFGSDDGDMECGWRGHVKDCRVAPYDLMKILADNARPQQDFPDGAERNGKDDWGSDRQVKAQNLFYETMRNYVGHSLIVMMERNALHATAEENLDYSLGLLYHATRKIPEDTPE